MKMRNLSIIVITVLFSSIILSSLPSVSAHGVCTGLEPRFIRPDSYMLSKESIHTGENVTITGKWVSLTDKMLQAKMLFYSEPNQHGKWAILEINPSGDFVIPGNSIIQYNI